MVWIPGGTFHMGSDAHYPEEAPVREVAVDGFWMDRRPVTNRDFARFVAETGHVSLAEQVPSIEDYPGADPLLLVAGSLVFVTPDAPGDSADWTRWWRFVAGANWRHPQGPDSSIEGLEDHPVVHVCHGDALAYARWQGKELPSEAQWEYAARGGLDRAEFAWGDALVPDGVHRANTWQGHFPDENLALDGYAGTSPVTAFPPNGYGLLDMIGNVWEWTDDWYRPHGASAQGKACCLPRNPRGGSAEESRDPEAPGSALPRKVLKGGSHLCAPNYCRRYRPAARQPQTIDTASVHIGFRCVRKVATP
ncbi:formylglycine-generating enzyme family protein [Xanthobacter versatilis]|uniref:formylglycine-generating enzyme family protein n=1 Tax=Xanthobacter autotrophicus (strain ATCC BAA-1158 / Py2) TaxID=78245 RepID=UPI0037271BE1